MNKQPLMDAENHSNFPPHANSNYNTSSVNTSENDSLMELHNANDAFNTFKCLILNNRLLRNKDTNSIPNRLTDFEERRLLDYVQKYKQNFASFDAIIEFANTYDIYFHVIAFVIKDFQTINEYILVEKDLQKQQAFIVLNGNKTVRGPLFSVDPKDGIRFVFALNDMRIKHYVDKYIEGLNKKDKSLFPLEEEESTSSIRLNVSQNGPVNWVSALANDSNPASILPGNEISESTSRDPIIQNILETSNIAMIPNIASLIIQGTRCQSRTCFSPNVVSEKTTHMPENQQVNTDEDNAAQSNGSDRVRDVATICIRAGQSYGLSGTTTAVQSNRALSPTTNEYEKPEIVRHPKEDWKSRYPKDLIPKPRTAATKHQAKKMKFVGLLQAVGKQRSQIQVKVPVREKRQLYLGSAVRTINNQSHSLKVIVQEKTKVNKDLLNRRNILNYLEFDECNNSMHFFDATTRNVYMKITPREHQKQRKNVPIYMFNFYQNKQLTKAMIECEQLDQCQLAFWLCIKKRNGNYEPVSPESFSCIITKQKNKRNNAST